MKAIFLRISQAYVVPELRLENNSKVKLTIEGTKHIHLKSQKK